MLGQLPTLQRLINQLRRIPYVASKNVYKIALHLLEEDPRGVDQLVSAIVDARERVALCERCYNWTETGVLCTICADPGRDSALLCLVETWVDLYAIERTNEYRGRYFILGGALSPLEGIGPRELHFDRLEGVLSDDTELSEIIFALNATPEGEATVHYILTHLSIDRFECSRLASGMPTGGQLSYIDRTTLHKALRGRVPLDTGR